MRTAFSSQRHHIWHFDNTSGCTSSHTYQLLDRYSTHNSDSHAEPSDRVSASDGVAKVAKDVHAAFDRYGCKTPVLFQYYLYLSYLYVEINRARASG